MSFPGTTRRSFTLRISKPWWPVAAVAGARGLPRAQIALAWVLQKSEVTAPIVGATRLEQLDDAVAALSLKLSTEEIKALEAPYVPHAVVGHA